MRLIDADALKKAIIHKLCIRSENYLLESERGIYNLIDKQPTIELLKEQQPKKVAYDINGLTGLPVSFCPSCGEGVNMYAYGRNDLKQVFCPYCGQALDWKDGDGE